MNKNADDHLDGINRLFAIDNKMKHLSLCTMKYAKKCTDVLRQRKPNVVMLQSIANDTQQENRITRKLVYRE